MRLKVDNLCSPGVDNVTLTLRQGEILGVAGLMGAGQTELMKVLYGALPRSSGSVTLDGREVVTGSPQDRVANGTVYISEDRKRDGLVLGMSVKENMSLTALRYFSPGGRYVKHKDEQQAVSDFIRLFNVKRGQWSRRSACSPAATSKRSPYPRADDPAEGADPR